MSNLASDETQQEFVRLRPEYVRFTGKLEALLRDLLAAKRIDFHLLESRTKDISSLRDKISRSSKAYKDPLTEITDLAGLRVITYYEDDADAIGRLIGSEFIIDQENSVLHSSAAAEFGYRSAHYIVSLGPSRCDLLEWSGVSLFRAEIQVRTVLQHAWAAISHKIQYKREEDVPVALRRKLFRLSALFEIADDEFVSLRDASGSVTRAIQEQVSMGNRQLLVDYVSLSKLIDTAPAVAEICAFAAEVGFSFEDVGYEEDFETDDRDTISDLIQLAAITGIVSIEKFETMLDESLPWAQDYLKAQYNDSGGSWHVTPQFVCELILIRSNIQQLRLGHLLRVGFGRTIASRVFEVAAKFGHPVSGRPE